jgi:hypothetical protein
VRPEIVATLQQLQAYATGMQGLLAQTQADLPDLVEGTDRSGAVRAVLGRAGLPESIVVDLDWRRLLRPEAFAAAVVEACQAAAGERMVVWSGALHAEDVPRRADWLRDELTEPAGPTVALPPELRRQLEQAEPRPLEHLVEDLLRSADRIDALAASSPHAITGTGMDTNQRIALTVSPAGLISCEVEPEWVANRPASALDSALREALRHAHEDLARASQAPGPAAELDGLLIEALAILHDPQRLAQS